MFPGGWNGCSPGSEEEEWSGSEIKRPLNREAMGASRREKKRERTYAGSESGKGFEGRLSDSDPRNRHHGDSSLSPGADTLTPICRSPLDLLFLIILFLGVLSSNSEFLA